MIMIQDGSILGEVMMDFNLLGYDKKFLKDISKELDIVLKSGYWSGGKYIKKIENQFRSSYEMHSVASSSGGMALELISKVFPYINKIGFQSNTYFASILPWINKEKEIVLIGSNDNSLTPSLEHVKEAFNLGIEAVLLTHIGGYPIPEIKEIAEFCRDKGILLIEDCAHSPFTKIDGKLVGSFGDASILSFFPTKPIPAGEGGMALFKNKKSAEEASRIRDYGKLSHQGKILHKLPAISNGRLNEFSAAIVYSFLKNYQKIESHKQKIASFYNQLIPNKYIYQINLKTKQVISHYKFITFVKSNKYAVSPVYDKNNQLYNILKFNDINFQFVGENPQGVNHICLPIFPGMTFVDVKKIVKENLYK